MASVSTAWYEAGQIGKHTKKLLLYAFVTAIASGMSTVVHGQTFSEWFSQKKTQKKYLLEQLAALRVYSDYLQKGYSVAQNGLGTVSSYLKDEYGSHSVYYDRLLQAGPAVRDDPQIREIIRRQADIEQLFGPLERPEGLSPAEIQYLGKVRGAVLHDCELQLQDLDRVISNGKLKAGDRERIEQLNQVHAAMTENYRFSSAFVVQVVSLIKGRKQQEKDAKAGRSMRGIQ
ncbi:hypothetical protein [Mucilaginibacter terrae]|uniref:TerB family tellurite resistance protein n=1 Tax=Mucilaginibacter terrae TaxID=1955052 RepID=A0ABU3GWZ5_9SPHI|nr:hypothetical protein [Mucilaginibacter terrae]MDT3404279.1 hypothetical protein [Mucilaginibacter terrae]